MTVTSASAIVVQLQSILGAVTQIGGSANVSYTGYDVLDTMTGSAAIVIRPGPILQAPAAFGRTDDAMLTFKCECYVKDAGNPTAYWETQWQAIDSVWTAISAKDDLNTTCDSAILRRVTPDDTAWSVNGQIFGRIVFEVEATVLGR